MGSSTSFYTHVDDPGREGIGLRVSAVGKYCMPEISLVRGWDRVEREGEGEGEGKGDKEGEEEDVMWCVPDEVVRAGWEEEPSHHDWWATVKPVRKLTLL